MPIDIEKIKTLRESKGLSVADAAREAGFKSRQHWYNIESGASTNPGVETLEAMAKVLGKRAKDLLK